MHGTACVCTTTTTNNNNNSSNSNSHSSSSSSSSSKWTSRDKKQSRSGDAIIVDALIRTSSVDAFVASNCRSQTQHTCVGKTASTMRGDSTPV